MEGNTTTNSPLMLTIHKTWTSTYSELNRRPWNSVYCIFKRVRQQPKIKILFVKQGLGTLYRKVQFQQSKDRTQNV